MKLVRTLSAVVCTALAFAVTAPAHAKPALRKPATYQQVLVDTRRIQNEYELATVMGARAVVLDLVRFGAGSDAFFQRGHKQDEIGFVCPDQPFHGGAMKATIVRSEASADAGRFYVLKDCTPLRSK